MASSSSTVKLASEEVIDRFLTNVDVWQTLFEMLSVKDRIRLEMTNKRLRMLLLEYWKRVTSFDSKMCLTEMSDNLSTIKKRWAAFVSICVNRMGDGLRSLTIRERSPIDCSTDNLLSIGEGCPNVETINFIFEDEGGTLDIHFVSFPRLKTITVNCGYIMSASTSMFMSIPTSIEVIRGLELNRKEPFENAAQMEGFFADRPSLREVDLAKIKTRDGSKADIFRVIAERCPHLKSIKLFYANDIHYSGVIALESMKELSIRDPYLNEMEIVTICDRSPLVEALEFEANFSSNIDLQSAALNALGALTKLCELHITRCHRVRAPSLFTEFVRGLARNSGASLRHLHLDPVNMPLSTAAMEALANGCRKLRYVRFCVRVGEATPASIRLLIDCIVADPSWIHQTVEPTLLIDMSVMSDGGDDAEAGMAAFKALAEPAANLPAGVELRIW